MRSFYFLIGIANKCVLNLTSNECGFMLTIADERVLISILLLSSLGIKSTSEMQIHHSKCHELSGLPSYQEVTVLQAYLNPHGLQITSPPKLCSIPYFALSKTILSLLNAKYQVDPDKCNFSFD